MRCCTWGWKFGADGDLPAGLSCSHHASVCANGKGRKKMNFSHVFWLRDALKMVVAAPGGMSRSGTVPELQIPP